MNIMKLSKQAFVVVLCSLLVGFTAQPEAYGSVGQSNNQPTAPGDEFDSPINPLIAYARQNLPTDQVGYHVPFNGYFFRILTSQGPHAPGGPKNYIVHGKMPAGFAFVAYPVEYGSSGEMTFIVDASGTIYEKDLGPDTTKLAQAMTAYDPDPTWHKAE